VHRDRKGSNPIAHLRAAVPEIQWGIAKKVALKKYTIPRSNLRFHISNKFLEFPMGPPPVLIEDEEQVLVKWTTDCSQEGFSPRKCSVPLFVKEFLIVNLRKTLCKYSIPENGWLQAFLRPYPELSTCTSGSDSITSSTSATVGDADIRK